MPRPHGLVPWGAKSWPALGRGLARRESPVGARFGPAVCSAPCPGSGEREREGSRSRGSQPFLPHGARPWGPVAKSARARGALAQPILPTASAVAARRLWRTGEAVGTCSMTAQPQSSPSSSTGSSLSGGRLRRRLRITMASGLPLSAFQRFQCFPPQGPAVPAASHPCRDRCRDHCRRADGTEAGASTAEDNDSDNDLDNDGTDHRSPTACARSLTRGVGNGHTGFLHVPADEQRP